MNGGLRRKFSVFEEDRQLHLRSVAVRRESLLKLIALKEVIYVPGIYA